MFGCTGGCLLLFDTPSHRHTLHEGVECCLPVSSLIKCHIPVAMTLVIPNSTPPTKKTCADKHEYTQPRYQEPCSRSRQYQTHSVSAIRNTTDMSRGTLACNWSQGSPAREVTLSEVGSLMLRENLPNLIDSFVFCGVRHLSQLYGLSHTELCNMQLRPSDTLRVWHLILRERSSASSSPGVIGAPRIAHPVAALQFSLFTSPIFFG